MVIFTAVLVIAGGAFGATQLNQQFFPDADFPFLAVTVQAPGLSAEQVDDQVAVPVEQAARGLEDIEETQTRSSEGRVTLVTQFAYGTDTETARDDLSAALDEVSLPEGAGEFDIQGGFTDQAIMNVALSTDGDPSKLTDRAEDVQDEIEQVPGVARVDLEGGTQEQYDVALKENAIDDGRTPAAVAQQIQAALGGQPVGAVETPRANTPLQVQSDEIDSIKELKDFPIDDDRELSDIATVRERPDPGTGLARTNGKPSVSLSVFGEENANQVSTIDATDEVLNSTRAELGPDNVTTILETATDVRNSIRGLLIEGILGALFAVVVIFIFLRSWRSTVIAAVSIPTSIVFGLLAAWALGLTLNIISLAGLTIAIGRVIDDAIVVLENIYKHLERGEPRFEAAYHGTREVVTAIGSSTLATAAVFIPLGVVGGLISEIFLSFSIIVVAALLASLLVAVTVIPVLATFLLKPKTATEKEGFLSRAVAPITRGGLRFRWLVIPAALLLFMGTIALVGQGAVPIQFLPDSGTQQVNAEIELPPGVSTERANRLLRPLEREVSEIDGVSDSQVSFGGAQLSFDPAGAGQGAQLFATFDESADVDAAVKSLRRFGDSEYPDGFEIQRLENGPPAGVFQATIRGDSVSEVERGAARVERLVERRSDTVEVSNDAAREEPQYVLEVDDDKSGTEEASQAAQALASLVPPASAGLTEDDTPIEVRLPNDLLKDADALEDLPVPAAAGAAGGGAASAAGAQAAASGAPGAAAVGSPPGGAG
ncbi:MAG: efflux RND transporter permease subunit, partial [Actinomycetota bacterium]|nr:efflux RND transporter permease subunit [Actinomycetota bacterium]